MSQTDQLTILGIVVTGVGSIAGVIGLLAVFFQLRGSQKIAKGNFLLELNEQLVTHEKAYRATMKLDWTPDMYGVTMDMMENYMSLFEQFKVLLDDQIIDFQVVDRLYGYRILVIVLNDHLFNKMLLRYGDAWPDFIALAKLIAKNHRRHPNKNHSVDEWNKRWQTFLERTDQMKSRVL
jgi:hypothetical protein